MHKIKGKDFDSTLSTNEILAEAFEHLANISFLYSSILIVLFHATSSSHPKSMLASTGSSTRWSMCRCRETRKQ